VSAILKLILILYFYVILSLQCATTDVTPTAVDDASCESAAVATRPAVHEVEFDEHGQTWDVYGAEFDPEILGQAIQTHLEHIMNARHQCSTAQSQSTDRDMTSHDDVIANRQSHATIHGKRDVIGRFLRYIRSETSTVNS